MEYKNNTRLGLDIGTNSIGWSLVEHDFAQKTGRIIDIGVRIIPMGQDMINGFNNGILESSTAQRTHFRSVRRLRSRAKLRRERLVRVLKIMGLLPIGFEVNPYHSIAYEKVNDKLVFKFKSSYDEMRKEILTRNPKQKIIPSDWTIYYLRSKALHSALTKEELAWVILQFNTKRGYHKLRGDESLETGKDQFFVHDYISKIIDTGEVVRGYKILNFHLNSGIIGEFRSKYLPDWEGEEKEFIMTQKELKDGTLKISLSVPQPDDWTLRKKKTESQIGDEMTVGQYIWNGLLNKPSAKIRGKLVHTIDRKFYKAELETILASQKKFHPELDDQSILDASAQSLYKHNLAHQNMLKTFDLSHLLINDIIFYQRPLRTKKHLIGNCKYETYYYGGSNGELKRKVKGAPHSHPLFQEFVIWNLIHNIRVFQNEYLDSDSRVQLDYDVTPLYMTIEGKENLFELLNDKEEVSTNQILKSLGLNSKDYKINYPDNKKIKGNRTRGAILRAVSKLDDIAAVMKILSNENLFIDLWHCLYSLTNNQDHLTNALSNRKFSLSDDEIEVLSNLAPFKVSYGALSVKAVKKILALTRCGKFYDASKIDPKTRTRIEACIDGVEDVSINEKVYEILQPFQDLEQVQGLPEWKASMVVYNRHSEKENVVRYESPDDVQLLTQHSLRNPIVEQVINETLLVVKDVWKKYGRPERIHVELGRELKLPNDKRRTYTERQQENYQRNERAKSMLRELMAQYQDVHINPHSKGHQEQMKIYEETALAFSNEIPDDVKKIRRKDDPSRSELNRYMLWLEQNFKSPYTGNTIPLSQLFTQAYEVEHIIPKAIYYDDSFNNKVICERVVNQFKGNMTAYEMICNNPEKEFGDDITLLEKGAYERWVKKFFKNNRTKMRNLLSLEVPNSFIARQLNDTRYIGRKLLEYLDPFVRDEKDQGARSRNLMAMPGRVTSDLRQSWGVHGIWKQLLAPRFKRMNQLTNSNDYFNHVGSRIDLSGYENELKRLDHRHHAADALVIACTSLQHIQFLSSLNNETMRNDLKPQIWIKEKGEGYGSRKYIHPWKTFTSEAKDKLENIIISFKKNKRVINRTNNYYQKYVEVDGQFVKKYVKQEPHSDFWAIRQPLHKETVMGKISVHDKKIDVVKALSKLDQVADPRIRKALEKLYISVDGKLTEAKKIVKKDGLKVDGKAVRYVTIKNDKYYASRTMVDESMTAKRLLKVSNSRIRRILMEHLDANGGDPKAAFSEEGLAELNRDLEIPIIKVRLMEKSDAKFSISDTGQKSKMFVEAAKGTGLFYVIEFTEQSEGNIVSKDSAIRFKDAIELLSRGLPLHETEDNHSYFVISPNDLVYLPDNYNRRLPNIIEPERIYKAVSFNGGVCYFVPMCISAMIVNKKEFGPLNKTEKSLDGRMIKKFGIKLDVDRLGHVTNR